MSTPKKHLSKYIKFKGGVYQQVVADSSVTPVETLKSDVRILSAVKKAQSLGGVASRAAAEEILELMFKADPYYAPDDADAYVGKDTGSKWQAFVDENDTITFEHSNGKRFGFIQPK